jgi:hypothetical protein
MYCLCEVSKGIARQSSENGTLQAAGVMQQGRGVDLDSSFALRAAKICLDHRLPMDDGVMLATARMHKATLGTQDPPSRSLKMESTKKSKPETKTSGFVIKIIAQ